MNYQIEGFRLSRSQERLWALEQTGPAYLAQCVVAIDGSLNKAILKEALRKIVQRQEILRTGFHRMPGAKYPVQVVAKSAAAIWREEGPVAGQGDNVERLIQQEKDRARNFEDPSLLRACLIEQTEHTHILLLTIPSLCADSRTLNNLVQELSSAYEAQLNGEELEGETVQYVQFAQWQSDLLEEDSASSGTGFWNKQGVFDHAEIRLPFQLSSRSGKEYRSDSYSQPVGPEIAAKIDSVARKYSVSLEEFLLACWQTLPPLLLPSH